MTPFDIKDFGAKGDGTTNDHDAFMKAADAINAQGGGHLIISPGTYIVGKQTVLNEGNIYYKGIEALYIHDCNGVVIEGFNAKIVYEAGLKYGYYESSGAVYTPEDLENRVLPLSGDIGAFIALGNCTNVEIKNLDIDGNNSQLSLGGVVGTGRQCIHYGVFTMTVRRLKMTNVSCHHFGTDGVSIRNLKPGAKQGDPEIPYYMGDQNILENVSCDYNGRNGLTLTGGSNITLNSCSFNHNATDPKISSKPKAGVDIEAEAHSDGTGYNYRIHFNDCQFINNQGTGLDADSGSASNLLFDNCLFWATKAYGVWLKKQAMQFNNCIFYGSIIYAFQATQADERTSFFNCLFEDKEHPEYGVYRADYLYKIDGQKFVHLNECTFRTHKTGALFSNSSTASADAWDPSERQMIKNCFFYLKTVNLPLLTPVMIKDSNLKDNQFIHYTDDESETNNTPGAYTVAVRGILTDMQNWIPKIDIKGNTLKVDNGTVQTNGHF